MTQNRKNLILLISSCVLAAVAIFLMIFATIQSAKYGKHNYSHDISVKNVKSASVPVNGVLYHEVLLEGGIQNNTSNNYEFLTLEIVFSGINNSNGEEATYTTTFVIDNVAAQTNSELKNEVVTVGNRSGFIPQQVKEIRAIFNDSVENVPYEKSNDINLILFSIAMVCAAISGVIFAKWFAEYKKTKKIKV